MRNKNEFATHHKDCHMKIDAKTHGKCLNSSPDAAERTSTAERTSMYGDATVHCMIYLYLLCSRLVPMTSTLTVESGRDECGVTSVSHMLQLLLAWLLISQGEPHRMIGL